MTLYQESCALVLPKYPRKSLQDTENHRAIAALHELIDSAVATAENYVAYTDGRLSPLGARGNDLIMAVAELMERYRHEAPCGWTEEKLMEHCEQVVTRAKIEEILKRPSLDVMGVQNILQTLQDAKMELPRGKFLLMRENLLTLKPHQPDDICRDFADICGALYEVQFVDLMAELRAELADFDDARDKALLKLKEATDEHHRAVAGGDVVEVERTHRHLITAAYEVVEIFEKRLREILKDDPEARQKGFASELETLRNDAEDAIGKFANANRTQRNAFQEDIRNCDRKRLEEDATHASCQEAYRTKMREMDADLSKIVQSKRKAVEELRQKARELRDLMTKQKEIAEEQIRVKRIEEERVTAYNEFVDMVGQQKQRLLRCLEYFDTVESVVPSLQSYVDNMIARMPKESLVDALNAVSDEEADEFMKAYSKFVLYCGELTVKKMHRLDTLERQARLMEHNRNSAMESLDPNMNNYRVQLEDLVEQMKAVSGVINALNATQDAGEQLFQNVEKAVLAKHERAATPFVHPLQEHGLRSLDERGRFVDRSMRYVEDEERKVVEKKNVLSRMRRAVEEEEATTELALRGMSSVPSY